MRRRGVMVAVLVACVVAPAPASAQTGDLPYVDAVDAWADGQALRRTLPRAGGGGTGATKPKRAERPRKATPRQLAKLRFTPSQAVTDASYQAVLALMDPAVDPASVTAELDRLRGLWDGEMRKLTPRLEPSDLGDVATYALTLSYAAYHERSKVPDAGLAAVRRSARTDLALNATVRRSSDARKQEAAQMLALRTILRVSDLNWGRQEQDAAREQAAADALRTWVKTAFGVDLDRVAFTRKGLVPR
jgi:hypothetical protein